jgi:pimeloyl-ACP methyl ester carboxylesterase
MRFMVRGRIWALLAFAYLGLHSASIRGEGRPTPKPDGEKKQERVEVPRECLVLPPAGRHGRVSVPVDFLAARIAAGTWKPPRAGDAVLLPNNKNITWEKLAAGKDGTFSHRALLGFYAYFGVDSPTRRVVLLDAAGHAVVYVNGEPRAGDIYQTGYVRLPVLLNKGRNDFLFHVGRFHVGRGRLTATLTDPKAEAMLNPGDLTLPDLIAGQTVDTEGAIVVLNAGTGPLVDLALEATLPDGKPWRTTLPFLPPLSMRKLGFGLKGPAPKKEGKCEVALRLLQKRGDGWQMLDTAKIGLGIVRPDRTHKRTFRSSIDGSVQYFAVVPPKPARDKPSGQNTSGPKASEARPVKPALVLTLHGAAVEAIGQAHAYAPLPDTYIVAPTNRRPYGFDWEDWGRLDALEVLDLAQKLFGTDPRRTYLTGHSMGGHGVWHLGVTYPDRFAAIGPSAGWISMWSYDPRSRRPDKPNALQEIFRRCVSPSDTLGLARNYLHHGVFILHGEKDDNVPVGQAREMNKHLAGFHKDFQYHEEPGVGHWWGKDKIPGAACVTWPPMFEFFARHQIPTPASVRRVEFFTASPGVSAWSHWAGIEAQIKLLKLSSVNLTWDPEKRLFRGTTHNVARLALDLAHVKPDAGINVELDGQKLDNIPWPKNGRRLYFQRQDQNRGSGVEGQESEVKKKWTIAPPPAPALKGPHRYGPFRDVFRNHVLLVYGTRGTEAENAWAFAKARFDAERFWYQGNGSLEMVADTAFDPERDPDRNVVLYGNADTNAAWKPLLADSPVQARRGVMVVGKEEFKADDLGGVFLRPRPGSDRALVGAVTGTGVKGMRLTDRLPFFVSGVGYPDLLVLRPESLTGGSKGVLVAGFFGIDWSLASGELVWVK